MTEGDLESMADNEREKETLFNDEGQCICVCVSEIVVCTSLS